MGNAIGTQRLILEREDEEYVWKFSAILEPMFYAPNVRELGVSYDLKLPPATIDISQNLSGAATTLTKHRGFQAVQPSKIATATEHRHHQEFNPAPLIFAALMIGVAAFHGWGAVQYYRGSVDNRVECKG